MKVLNALLSACLVSAAFACGAAAQDDIGADTQRALEQLEQARAQLERAETANARIQALTQTIRAYEQSLGVLRNSMRGITLQKERLSRELTKEEAEVSALLSTLMQLTDVPLPAQINHPNGPVDTARAAMLLGDVVPSLQEQVTTLKARLERVEKLDQLHSLAQSQLIQGLGEVQTARTDLARAISDRSDLPRRFVEDNKKIAILKSATSTLEAFTGQLSFIVTNEVGGSLPDISYRKGDLPLPAQGRIIRKFNETDAAGIVRPGIVVATAPEALVTTPTAATIRYNGEFFEYGLVTILEPQAGMLFVFAGMNVVFGKIGEVLPAGSPVGLMGGTAIQGAEDSLSSSSISSDLQQTLYIEVRENTSAIDPLGWFKE